jgi:hypothetical protein
MQTWLGSVTNVNSTDAGLTELAGVASDATALRCVEGEVGCVDSQPASTIPAVTMTSAKQRFGGVVVSMPV